MAISTLLMIPESEHHQVLDGSWCQSHLVFSSDVKLLMWEAGTPLKQVGLYVHSGGFPVWLKYVPGIGFRTVTEPFKIENEYGLVEWEISAPRQAYTKWAAQMAVCKQDDAPNPIVV